jgi:hypothetical protein
VLGNSGVDAVSPAQQYGRWRPGAIHIAGGFVLFVIAWTAYGSLDFAGKAIHGDVAEAYAWGREFRLGYNQHPPFWAWIAGA